jgi:hypothetical protein
MRVMILYRGESDHLADPEFAAACARFNDEAVAAGLILSGEPLKPSRQAKRLLRQQGRSLVVDGPFAESREVIAGFSIWNVDSMEHAIEWMNRHPLPPSSEQAEFDIYPLYDWEAPKA